MIDWDGVRYKALLSDFGLSRVVNRLPQSGLGLQRTYRHPRYAAPELFRDGHHIGPTTNSDIYSLGCLGLEVSTLQLEIETSLKSEIGT